MRGGIQLDTTTKVIVAAGIFGLLIVSFAIL
jgi:hypothetical protein